MKKIFLAFLAMAACMVACNPEEAEIIESLELKGNAEILLSVEGDMASISFTSSVDWTAASSADWLTITPTSGKAGEATVKASALRNESNDSRSANVTITAGSKEAVVKVTQAQTDAINIAETEFVVEAEGGEVEVEVEANVEYEVLIPAAVDWIHVAETKGMVSSTVSLAVDATELYDLDYLEDEDHIIRSANVTIKYGEISKVVAVAQKTFIPYFNYTGDWADLQWSFYSGSPTVIPQEGADIEIDVATNIEWKVYMSYWDNEVGGSVQRMDNGWAHLSFDVETGKINLKIDANDSYFARTDYIYAVGIVNGQEDGNFGGLGQITQEGLVPEGAAAELKWHFALSELNIPAGYNRLAYKTLNGNALIVSDGDKIHALSPANGQYFKNITWTTVKPTSICSDDAGNVIVGDDYPFSVGTEYKVYYTADVNSEPVELFSHTADFEGTIGGWRIRGDIANKAVVTAYAAGARFWAGWEIVEGKVKLDANAFSTENGGQVRGPIKGTGDAWTPEAGAVMSRETTLAGGVIYRAYDILQSTWYLADAYTPNWQVPYEWTLLSDAGVSGNENQNNIAIADYKGKIIMAYTQGFHFAYSDNATIYVFDITDMNDVKTLTTISGKDYLVEDQTWTGSNSADVLLHPGAEALELYVVHSGMNTLARIDLLIAD